MLVNIFEPKSGILLEIKTRYLIQKLPHNCRTIAVLLGCRFCRPTHFFMREISMPTITKMQFGEYSRCAHFVTRYMMNPSTADARIVLLN